SEVVLNGTKSAAQNASLPAVGAAAVLKGDVSICSIMENSRELLAAVPQDAQSGNRAAESLAWVLQSLGFTAPSGKHTALGSTLSAGLRALQSSSRERPAEPLQWAVVAAAVLLGQGLLTGEKWSVAYESEHSPVGDARQQRFIRIVSRIATLVPPGARRGPWKLGYSRDLLAFSSAARLVQKAVGSSADAALLIGAVVRGGEGLVPEHTQQLQELRRTMPVECTTSDATGLLAHALLVDYVRSGAGCWGRIQAAAEESMGGARQALRDAWSVVGAVQAMAKAHGDADKDIGDACSWAQTAFAEALP
ncbi:hypothetical protein IWW50_006561, partial [Coemansia erecta]